MFYGSSKRNASDFIKTLIDRWKQQRAKRVEERERARETEGERERAQKSIVALCEYDGGNSCEVASGEWCH